MSAAQNIKLRKTDMILWATNQHFSKQENAFINLTVSIASVVLIDNMTDKERNYDYVC
jgi:hypothetical protein